MEVLWRVTPLPHSTSLLIVDVLARQSHKPSAVGFNQSLIDDFPASSTPLQFLLTHRRNTDGTIRFLIPTVSGYLIQSDIMQRRLVDCVGIVKVHTFITLDDHFLGHTADACIALGVKEALDLAIGAIVFSTTFQADLNVQITYLDQELTRRLSFAWHSATPAPKRCLAAIRPGALRDARNLSKIEDFVATATSLNISVVMFDDPSHGMGDAEWAHLRQDFVPLNMTVNATMSQRIVCAVSSYPKQIDGIACMYEPLLAVVAEAATLLHLFTSSPESIENARNKYKTRQFNPSLFCHGIKNPNDLERFLDCYRTIAPIPLPLIIKPASGWASEGVSKATNEREIRTAVTQLWRPPFSDKYGRDENGLVVIEPYVSGPEVDCNMVVIDGKVVFFEVNDDFPSSGDTGNGDFAETLNAMPSVLPENEITALSEKVLATLLAMGFKTGVFHVEARVHGSSYSYTEDKHRVIDLAPKRNSTTERKPIIFILEVNPRPPGPRTGGAAARTYGISYRSLALLTAIQDHDRMRALAVPYVGGAQYYMEALFVASQKGGTYRYGDVSSTIFEREPSLGGHVVYSTSYLRDGQEIPDPRTGRPVGIAHFLVISREGRQDVRRVSDKIQRLVRDLTDGF